MVPGCEQAHVLLPSATYAERDGTFTNFQGHLQRINAAFAPRGEALPAWQIYTRLAQRSRAGLDVCLGGRGAARYCGGVSQVCGPQLC